MPGNDLWAHRFEAGGPAAAISHQIRLFEDYIGLPVLERSGRAWLPVVAALQTVTFATTWVVGNSLVGGTPSGWPVLALASGLTAGLQVVVNHPQSPVIPWALRRWQ